MKSCISFNGVDGSGKTTQIELLQKKNPDIIEVFGGLENYYPFKMHVGENNFQWWFYDSTPDEFCNTMYESIKEREKDIGKSTKPIILIDKGIDNFDARILATLQFKGINVNDAVNMIKIYKEKHSIRDNEDLKLFFDIADSSEKRREITDTRIISNMETDKRAPYYIYQQMQNEIIDKQLSSGIYTIFNAKGTIEDIAKRLKNQIIENVKKNLSIPIDRKIYALGGMSECGKSGAGEYLSRNHNIWNMKLKYFNQEIAQKYGIENIFQNEKEFSSLLIAEEIISILNTHYYKEKISVESLHDFDITQQLKDIFGDVLQIIYIDTSYKNRVVRTAMGEKIGIEDAKKQVDKKDEMKSMVGADKIKDIADNIVDNNGSQRAFKEQLNLIAVDRTNYVGGLRNINDFNVPEEYRLEIRNFYDSIKNQLGDKIKLFLITGSCARGCVNPGWSDIDIIMVTDENNSHIRDEVSRVINRSKIKIGTTIYSLPEFQGKKIDLKTAYAIHEMEQDRLRPVICDKNLEIPVITNEQLKEMCNNIVPHSLHSLRRLLYTNENVEQKNEDKIFKELSHLMRDYLLQEDINATDYQDVYNKFANQFGFEKFDTREFIYGKEKQVINNYCNNIIDTFTNNKKYNNIDNEKDEYLI